MNEGIRYVGYDEGLKIDIARAMSMGETGTGNDTKWAE